MTDLTRELVDAVGDALTRTISTTSCSPLRLMQPLNTPVAPTRIGYALKVPTAILAVWLVHLGKVSQDLAPRSTTL